MVILRVNFEMFREVVDALAQNRHLHFGRPGIAVVSSVIANNPGLAVLGQRHDRSSTNGPDASQHQTAVRFLTLVTRKTYHSKSVQPPVAKLPGPIAAAPQGPTLQPACPAPPARRC